MDRKVAIIGGLIVAGVVGWIIWNSRKSEAEELPPEDENQEEQPVDGIRLGEVEFVNYYKPGEEFLAGDYVSASCKIYNDNDFPIEVTSVLAVNGHEISPRVYTVRQNSWSSTGAAFNLKPGENVVSILADGLESIGSVYAETE